MIAANGFPRAELDPAGSAVAMPPATAPARRQPPYRRRAAKACLACHHRKVRCDVAVNGLPCTNCRLDQQDCQVRGRLARKKAEGTEMAVQPKEKEKPAAVESMAGGFPDVLTSLEDSFALQPVMALPDELEDEPEITAGSDGFLHLESLENVPAEDVNFMNAKGCFHVPSRPMLDEFVREYFLHVHPNLPILNEGEFWLMFLGSRRTKPAKRFSLFVFQAMLCASCSFLSMNPLRKCGFKSILQARSVFYTRAKLLFDFHTERNPIALAQGALLLSYYASGQYNYINTTWLRTAIQFANVANAHVYHRDTSLTPAERNVKKRLWWCCLLRDRILPLAVRRPIQITRSHFDLSEPGLGVDDLCEEFGQSHVYNYKTKQLLAELLAAQCTLAVLLTNIITIVYPPDGMRQDLHCSDDLARATRKLDACRSELTHWYAQTRDLIVDRNLPSDMHKSVTLYAVMLDIYYHSARAALAHHEVLLIESCSPQIRKERTNRLAYLANELQISSAGISNPIQEIVQLNLAKYLPIAAVAHMSLPLILSGLDLELSRTTVELSLRRRALDIHKEAMDICRLRYDGAETLYENVQKTIQYVASEPAQLCGSPTDSMSTALVPPVSLPTLPLGVKDWTEALRHHPRFYLRVSLSLDIALSRGRYPELHDFPKLLLITELPARHETGFLPGSGQDFFASHGLTLYRSPSLKNMTQPRFVLMPSSPVASSKAGRVWADPSGYLPGPLDGPAVQAETEQVQDTSPMGAIFDEVMMAEFLM